MKKIFALMMAVALTVLVLTGCGGAPASTPAPGSEAASTGGEVAPGFDLNALVAAVEAVNPVSNARDVDDNFIQLDMLLTAENIAAYTGKVSNDQGNSALIVAIQAVEGKAADVKTELDAYKAGISTGGMYSEFAQMEAMAKDARIVVKGDVLVMVVANTQGADYAEIDKALDEALK